MKDTILFDLDGTLLDSLEDLADSTNYALLQHGLAPRRIEEIRQFVGNGVDQLIKRAVGGALKPELELKCLQTFKEYYKGHMYQKTRPYEGILEVIRMLWERKVKIAIVSNKFDSFTHITPFFWPICPQTIQ